MLINLSYTVPQDLNHHRQEGVEIPCHLLLQRAATLSQRVQDDQQFLQKTILQELAVSTLKDTVMLILITRGHQDTKFPDIW